METKCSHGHWVTNWIGATRWPEVMRKPVHLLCPEQVCCWEPHRLQVAAGGPCVLAPLLQREQLTISQNLARKACLEAGGLRGSRALGSLLAESKVGTA